MYSGISILPLSSSNALLERRMAGFRSGQLLILRLGNYPWRTMNHNLANDMKMWKGKGNTTTLLFSLKGLEIIYQERRGRVKTIVMEHFNGIIFHNSGPADRQHTNDSLIGSERMYNTMSKRPKKRTTDIFKYEAINILFITP